MEDADIGEYGGGRIVRLTMGPWIDTHCQWSPRGDWIVFSSNRDKPSDVPELDPGLPGYLAVFLVKASDPSVVVRVTRSGFDGVGFVNYPVFSPDGKSIAVTADLGGVSVDPVSLPHFWFSLRPSANLFSADIDLDDILKSIKLAKLHRITHSRYEISASTWVEFLSLYYENPLHARYISL